ncbi:MAG: hypothetical protein HY858_00045 [Candidatus Solibacter usitatus]|nr:hypothetical protein [Candidatus Solibacter usitatus]
MIPRRALLTALPLLASCNRRPGSGYRGTAFVSTEETPSVVAVDLLAFAVKSRIDMPAPPSILAAHPDSRRRRIFALSPAGRSVEEIDSAARVRVKGHRMPGAPVAVHAAARDLWFLTRETPHVASLDGRRIALPAEPVEFDISPASKLACVTLEGGALLFADLEARRAGPMLKLGGELGGIRFRSDGKIVLVADKARRQLTVVDVAARQVMAELPLALSPDRLCMNSDGGQLFITGEGRDAVAIAYTYRTEIAQTSLSGRKPGMMAVSAGPDYLFVANPQAGSVTVFDTATQRVVAVTGVGMEPGAMVVTPDQQYTLVLNRASGDMAVIRIAAITPGRNKTAPLFTMIPVGSKPVDVLVVPA